MPVLYLSPLSGYIKNEAAKKKLWIYEGNNTLASSAAQAKAEDMLPNVIKKNEEAEIRDALTGHLICTVYQNRIGKETLEFMHQSILTMFQDRTKVKRDEIEKLKQENMVAAGYLCTQYCGVFTYVQNVSKKIINT